MSGRKHILIIEDEIDLSLLLREYFVRKGYSVSIAHTLSEGSALLEQETPDILFLDNNLPDGIGWTMAPGIASKFPEMFIVFISAFHPSLPQMPEQAQYKILEKPISFSALDKQFAEL